MSRGSEVKSLTGIGIFLVMYSQITSMLYLSWAEMGMIGAPSATVPVCVWGEWVLCIEHLWNNHSVCNNDCYELYIQ